jgi:hypothetical protein
MAVRRASSGPFRAGGRLMLSLSPSIGASLVSTADVKSAGGSTPSAARAFVSAPASTPGNIA